MIDFGRRCGRDDRQVPTTPHAGVPDINRPQTSCNSPWGTGDGPRDGDPATPANSTRPTDERLPDGDAPEIRDGPGPDGSGQANPWLPHAPNPGKRGGGFEHLFRRNGGPRLRLPQRPGGKSWLPVIAFAATALWLVTTTLHRIGPQEQGLVTSFGAYSRTIPPGMALTLPWPFQTVTSEDVTSIRRETIPESDGENLMLTSDANLVDISYLVRWNIRDLKRYSFQLAEPDLTVKEVAEAAMRQSIAEMGLNDVMGAGRAALEQNVRERMQRVLDGYHAGVTIQGVDIKKTDPPAKAMDAFKDVLAAEQDADTDVNQARAWARQLTAHAEGEAAAFDKVYAQYKLSPEVTRRRMYYETMERVLSQTDKVIVEAPGAVPYVPIPGGVLTPRAPDAPAGH